MIASLKHAGPSMYQLSIEQYHAMRDAGIFSANDRVELLEGCLVKKMTPKPPHAVAVSIIDDALRERLPKEWRVRIQQPITLKDSEPEPDVAVVPGPQRHFLASHPRPRDVALLIEVGDITMLDDRRYKGKLYAQARTVEFWLINLVDEVVEVYTSPRAGREPGFQACTVYRRGDAVPLTPGGEDHGRIAVEAMLP